jgi:hypothetical protein
MEINVKICERCNKEFESPIKIKKYCSKKCQARAKADRNYKKNGKGSGVCKECGKEFKFSKTNQKYCSNKCSGKSRRKYLDIPDCLENSKRKIDKSLGYVRIYVPMHKEANTWGYVYEHRVVAEKMIGRGLEKDEVVHHINGKRWDNREENLEVMDKRKHSSLTRFETNGELSEWSKEMVLKTIDV